jgi:hypothetical protein
MICQAIGRQQAKKTARNPIKGYLRQVGAKRPEWDKQLV